jgi:FMNH2-dependent dimethyl sulfone monooxygenase
MAAKLKFGVRLNIQGEMGASSSGFDFTLQMARVAEDLGFDSVWMPDHLENAHLDRSNPILEHWTTLTAVGALTKRVRLGGHTYNDNLRHPGLTAKIAATVDQITGGRLILAPGSGWFGAEAEAYGIEWLDPDGRKARLRESIQVMQSLFTQEKTSFEGHYFQLRDAYCNPKPVQKPYPPFWIGGEAPKTQEMVEAFGDYWFMYSRSPAQVAELVAPMLERRRERPLGIALSTVYLSSAGDRDPRRWAEMYAAERAHRFTVPPTVDDVMAANLLGDVGRVHDRLAEWAEIGVDYVVIQPMPPMEGMRHFGEKILPHYL